MGGALGLDYVYCGELDVMLTRNAPYLVWPLAVRFTVKISPKNGAAPSIIIKTFEINHEFRNWPYW